MKSEDLKKRVETLKQALEQSMTQHNALVGRYAEAQFMLEESEKEECPATMDAAVEG